MINAYDFFIEKMDEENFWDDVDVIITQDYEGDRYFIVDSWSSHGTLTTHAKDILGLGKDAYDYEVEEALGVEIVFSDEYTICSDCNFIIRTSPDSYHWRPEFYIGDGFIVCSSCFEENGYIESYIEEMMNEPHRAINGLITESQLEGYGFEELGVTYQNGFYGEVANPREIYDELCNDYEDIVFFINESGQFHVNFKVFVRNRINNEENVS